MDNVIELNTRRRSPLERPRQETPASVVFFPGVRYERVREAAQPAGRPPEQAPKADRRSN